VAGALFSFFLLVNIVLLNFSFDISVKLFSLFLLFLSLLLILPHRRSLFLFFTGSDKTTISIWKPVYTQRIFYVGKQLLKIILIVLIIADPLWHYIRTKNFNDDLAQRPPLHGAYEVESFMKNSQTLSSADPLRWKRVFVHRRNYFIVQANNEQMKDYPAFVDTARHKIMLELAGEHAYLDYRQITGDHFSVAGNFFGDTLKIELNKINLQHLPLMQKEFHWMIDN
jgi:hypothetical protein